MSRLEPRRIDIYNGDTITISGRYVQVPNRRFWWQFWKPKFVNSDELQRFIVTESYTHEKRLLLDEVAR